MKYGGVTIHDSCLRVVKRFPDDSIVTQRKRRPIRFTDDADCSWHESVPCPDHPRNKRETFEETIARLVRDAPPVTEQLLRDTALIASGRGAEVDPHPARRRDRRQP